MGEHYGSGPQLALPYQIWTAALADDLLGIDLNAAVVTAGDNVAVFDIPFKCRVIYTAIILTETCTSVTLVPIVKFTKRPTAGSDVGITAGDLGTIYPTKTGVAGKVYYDKVAQASGSTLWLEPGMEVVVEVDMTVDNAAAGHFRPILVVEKIPETMANLADMVETA